ncbi:MAG: polysaccharide deacetylase family protein [Betaproteobacteria bacterium]
MLEPRQRYRYSSPFKRPPLKLPEGRLIVWPVVNIEDWSIHKPTPRHVSAPPGGQTGAIPDMPNWTWHEYGMRVGIWRLLDTLERLSIKPTLSINAKVCETCPEVAQPLLDAGWEFMAHCYEQASIHAIPDQAEMIARTVDVLEKFIGKRPTGWLGPGRTQKFDTLEHVKAAGFLWHGDWVIDDQPIWVHTLNGPMVALPYSCELNDIPIMVGGHHESNAMLKRTVDAFDELYSESEHSARVVCIAVHPYISGAAHRIRYFRELLAYMKSKPGVLFWNGERIYEWFVSQRPSPDFVP